MRPFELLNINMPNGRNVSIGMGSIAPSAGRAARKYDIQFSASRGAQK
jgi:hypothetical protein